MGGRATVIVDCLRRTTGGICCQNKTHAGFTARRWRLSRPAARTWHVRERTRPGSIVPGRHACLAQRQRGIALQRVCQAVIRVPTQVEAGVLCWKPQPWQQRSARRGRRPRARPRRDGDNMADKRHGQTRGELYRRQPIFVAFPLSLWHLARLWRLQRGNSPQPRQSLPDGSK
jgi:hypothetical protein